MNKKIFQSYLGIVSIAILPFITGCRNNSHCSLECTINYIRDNMPYDDDDYVNIFSEYPRRIRFGCTIKNTSDMIVSLPFKTMQDTTCSSCFKVMIKHTDEIPIMVEQIGYYDKYNLMPQEIIKLEICSLIFKYGKGKYGKMSLQDLLRLIKVEYEKDINDKSLSENKMVDVDIIWNKDLLIQCKKKGNRDNKCGP